MITIAENNKNKTFGDKIYNFVPTDYFNKLWEKKKKDGAYNEYEIEYAKQDTRVSNDKNTRCDI